MKCPYGNHEHGATVRKGDKMSKCLICGKSAKVKTVSFIDEYRYKLVKTGRNKLAEHAKVKSAAIKESQAGKDTINSLGFRSMQEFWNTAFENREYLAEKRYPNTVQQ